MPPRMPASCAAAGVEKHTTPSKNDRTVTERITTCLMHSLRNACECKRPASEAAAWEGPIIEGSMSAIYPFAALRPTPKSAAAVAAVPYDVVSTDEARALASGNALSFLHVSRPEIDMGGNADPHAPAAYDQAAKAFAVLKSEAPL